MGEEKLIYEHYIFISLLPFENPTQLPVTISKAGRWHIPSHVPLSKLSVFPYKLTSFLFFFTATLNILSELGENRECKWRETGEENVYREWAHGDPGTNPVRELYGALMWAQKRTVKGATFVSGIRFPLLVPSLQTCPRLNYHAFPKKVIAPTHHESLTVLCLILVKYN